MKDKKGISLFAKNLLNVLGTKIFIYIWTLGGSVFIARILGPEKKGELALVISIYSIGIQILNIGLHSSNTYYISQDKNNTKYALGNSLIITLFTLCLSGVGFFICRKIGIFHLNNILLFVSFIMIPVGIFVLMQKNIILAFGAVKQYNILEIIDNGIVFLLAIMLSLFFKINIEDISICYLLGAMITGGYSLYIVKKMQLVPAVSTEKLRTYLPYGIQAYISCLMSFLVLKADVFMLNYYMDKYNVGIYSLAVGMGEMVFMLSSSVSLLLFPHLGTLNGTKQRKMFIEKVYKIMIPISLTIILLMFIMAKVVILLMYGKEYYEAVLLLRLILPGILFWSLSQYLYSFFSAENHLIETIVVPAVGFLLNIFLNYILIPLIGAKGAAISSSITYGFCLWGMILSYVNYLKRVEKNEKK